MTDVVRWWLGFWPLRSGAVWWATSTAARPDDDPLWGIVPGEQLGPLLAQLDDGLPQSQTGEDRETHSVEHAWEGSLARPEMEQSLSLRLGELLLPEPLRERLRADGRCDEPAVTVVIASGPSLARVPWEMLAVDGEELRLIECAVVRGGLSPIALHGRAIQPRSEANGHVLRIVDPGPPRKRLYDYSQIKLWRQRGQNGDIMENMEFDRNAFSELLQEGPRRLLYVGHAGSGPPEQPSAAHLIINEPGDWHKFTAAEWLRDPFRWPMPPRVAIVACQSDDTHHYEQMGLIMAAVHSGAEIITGTRWGLPADDSHPESHHRKPTGDANEPNVGPTTELAFAVDAAHDTVDPIRDLRRWQLKQLDEWRRCPCVRHAPLIWASPVTYLAPRQVAFDT